MSYDPDPRNMPGPDIESRVEIWSALHEVFDWAVCAAGIVLILIGLAIWHWNTR